MERAVTSQNEPATCVASRVPPELMDAIIDAGKDDKRFLKTCGLVCRAWVPASRHHLFERITVGFFDVHRFNSLLQSELVTFPRHIQHLKFRGWNTKRSECQVLSQLERIGSFQSLTKLCISESFHDSFDDLAKIFLMCNVLEDLSLVSARWPRQRASKSVPPAGSLPLLRHLAIRSVSVPEDVIAWLLSLQPVPALQSFALHSYPTKERLLRVQLNTLSHELNPSLRHLDIDGGLSHLWEFSHSTELHIVTFGLDLDKERYSLTAILPSLEPIISSIRDVVFEIYEVNDWDDENCDHLVNRLYYLDLRELDELLCQPQFLTLQAIRFRLDEGEEGLGELAERKIKERMPASLSRGILSIQNKWMMDIAD